MAGGQQPKWGEDGLARGLPEEGPLQWCVETREPHSMGLREGAFTPEGF